MRINNKDYTMTRNDVAALLGVHVGTVDRWLRQGTLPFVKESGARGRIWFARSDVLDSMHNAVVNQDGKVVWRRVTR